MGIASVNIKLVASAIVNDSVVCATVRLNAAKTENKEIKKSIIFISKSVTKSFDETRAFVVKDFTAKYSCFK